VIAPEIRAMTEDLVASNELTCASPWTRSEPSRIQFLQTTAGCVLFLQRSMQDDYSQMPGPVAAVAFAVSRSTLGRPFLSSVDDRGTTETFYIEFDYPRRNSYAVDPLTVTYARATNTATATWSGERLRNEGGEDCPNLPPAFSPTS
jgi:hypothetical protein